MSDVSIRSGSHLADAVAGLSKTFDFKAVTPALEPYYRCITQSPKPECQKAVSQTPNHERTTEHKEERTNNMSFLSWYCKP